MAEVKITKAEKLQMIKAIVEASESEDKVMLVETIDTILAQDANKAAKAKERAAAKRAEGDALRATVQSVLTDEFQSAQAITDAIDDEEVTKAKVIARLKQLVDTGIAVKEEVKIGEKKQMAYRLAQQNSLEKNKRNQGQAQSVPYFLLRRLI